jgi:hypothetical protein
VPATFDEIRVKQYIYDNCLSSNLISIALAYFLNPLHPGPKCPIQFFLIVIRQKLLQAIKELVVINHLNAFKFCFTVENQQKSLGAKSGTSS